MAKSILQKLYDGEIYPSENIRVDTPEYNDTQRALTSEKECFVKTLSDESRESFNKIEELYGKLINIYSYADFAYGFRLAVDLIFDARNGNISGYNQNEKG